MSQRRDPLPADLAALVERERDSAVPGAAVRARVLSRITLSVGALAGASPDRVSATPRGAYASGGGLAAPIVGGAIVAAVAAGLVSFALRERDERPRSE